ncbi:MAG: ABC transporter ATP-binding protein [Actinomycetota bacterium]
MSDVVVKVEGLSKRYRIGANKGRSQYGRLTESLWEGIQAPIKRLRGKASARNDSDRHIWALKDLSLEVRQGEVVGIIGRNGAGKTTLLKILSRITEPTEGFAEIHGRVGSLLEVGTGFHPELTGRENIYLNGAVLGMRRVEIQSRLDQIVDFAGVERFMDTPVKRFSTGMYLRLAFSVAAHLEPDILLVDEVLAVGDVDFQRKCLGKMEDVAHTGRTVIFVSHSMPSILRLCPRAILLDQGGLIAHGSAHQVVRTYLESGYGTTAERVWSDSRSAPGDDVVRLKSIRVRADDGTVREDIDIRYPVSVEVEYWHLARNGLRPSVNLHFYNEEGVCLFVTNDFNNAGWWERDRELGLVRATCRIPGNFLAEGRVLAMAAISTYNPTHVHALERDAVAFQVVDRSEGDGVRGVYAGDWPGVIRPMLDWDVMFDASVPPEVRP